MTIFSLEPTSQTEDCTFPASFTQERFWYFNQLESNNTAYNIITTLHINMSLNLSAFKHSLNLLIQRHAILRTTFVLVEEQLTQVVNPTLIMPLPVVDLYDLSKSIQDAELLRLVKLEAQHHFDLAQGPLIRTTLLKLGTNEYVLLMNIHHIVTDGRSLIMFYQELATLYKSFSRGESSSLPDIAAQYADFSIQQRELVQKDMFTDQLAYWKQQLMGAPTTLDLPTDRSYATVSTYRGAIHEFVFSKHLTQALKALHRQEGVTLYRVLVAAFQTLLYRYTSQEDIVIGSPVAGRVKAEMKQVFGPFINTVAIRTDLSNNPTFRELLVRVNTVVTSALAHQEIPFEYLVKELQPERNVGRNPLFQVLLNFRPALPSLPSEWVLEAVNLTGSSTMFDLSLELTERPEELIGLFQYNAELFDVATIQRMVGHLQTLLEGVVADPSQRIAELPLLTEQEGRQILTGLNDTQKTYPTNQCIHQLFEAQVERTPDAIAVVYEDMQLTYRELNIRANQLAHYLQRIGVGPDVLVALCIERSLEMMIGLLGILKAGGTYMPLDPTYPSERLAFMVVDAVPLVLVTQQHLVTYLPALETKVVCMDSDAALLQQQSQANVASTVTPNNLAYVIYTSGSTGRPKGVQISQRAVVNFLTSMRHQPGLTEQDTLLAVTTLSFDIAALELFLPLIVGARLVIASREVVTNGPALLATLARSHATVMQATPITWRILLTSGWQGDRHIKMLCGGEALSRELVKQLLLKGGTLWNLYGPTETTIWSAVCKIEPEDEVISIGGPIANTQIYLLDKQLQLVPIGVPGELYIGGAGVARGYLNRPELTSERFIPNPFSTGYGERLYKTGDLARYRVDGTIEVLGRLDHQVKLRGFRIELGEIETLIRQHHAVQDVVVIAREDVPGDKRLVAYVVLQKQQDATANELRSHTMKHLPAYMIPSTFVLLEVLPTTPNGKVDRRMLPAPEATKNFMNNEFVAPRLLEHEQLIQVWEELLGVRPIGIRDNFFDLGGHSLLAVRLVNRIEQVCGIKVSLATLFAEPTIERLVDAFYQQEEIQARTSIVKVQAGESRQPFFFLHGDYVNGGAFYCFPMARGLGTNQPFYALTPYKFDGLQVPPRLEAIAAAHIKSMRAVQPQGPYLLGGFCNGGIVAYEMACQLHAIGQTVDLLALIDPTNLTYPPHLKALHHVLKYLGTLLHMREDKPLELFLCLRHIYNYVRYSHYRKGFEGAEHVKVEKRTGLVFRQDKVVSMLLKHVALVMKHDDLRRDWWGIFQWLSAEYVPSTYFGNITFFWASEVPLSMRSKYSKVGKEVETYVIQDTHLGCRTNPLLIDILRTCLDRVQEQKAAK